jgi:2-polyprenyl-3-methyl-5-hydroxy-6-metoxy-1,4-benzoquinol methylase
MSEHFDKLANTWNQNPMKVERARLTAECCKKLVLNDYTSLLDFGGGTGLLSGYLQDTFDAITIADSSKEMLKVAQKKISDANFPNIRTFKIENDLSEISQKYSAIIMLMTLHHILDIAKLFKDAANLLSDQGALMIADLYKEDGSFHKHVPDYDGHNGFEIQHLSELLEKAGFTVKQVNEYFEIEKKLPSGEARVFPLFFLWAEKE